VILSLFAVGCTKTIELTDQESKMVAEYAAELLLKYDRNMDSKYYSDEYLDSVIKDLDNALINKISNIKLLLDNLYYYVESDYFNKINEALIPLFNSNNYNDVRLNLNIKLPRLVTEEELAKNYKDKILTIPNVLSVVRILLLIPFIMLYRMDKYGASIGLLFLSGATDMIDGFIARRFNMISTVGKILDPLADKMLTTAAYLGFICVYADKPAICLQMTIITFLVLFREFMVSSIRLVVVSSGGKVIAANMWGKAKTVSQMLGIIFALFAYVLIKDFGLDNAALVKALDIIICVLFWISAVLCTVSGLIYLNGSKQYINSSK
jgi:CDP-diacylglycerol--glycerol-3-phosphate 3-phosphatidyltransferase